MNFVWITSYLFVFIFGGAFSLFAAYKTINRWSDQQAKEQEAADARDDLSKLLAQYTLYENHSN